MLQPTAPRPLENLQYPTVWHWVKIYNLLSHSCFAQQREHKNDHSNKQIVSLKLMASNHLVKLLASNHLVSWTSFYNWQDLLIDNTEHHSLVSNIKSSNRSSHLLPTERPLLYQLRQHKVPQHLKDNKGYLYVTRAGKGLPLRSKGRCWGGLKWEMWSKRSSTMSAPSKWAACICSLISSTLLATRGAHRWQPFSLTTISLRARGSGGMP